jgi:hypothetical protein
MIMGLINLNTFDHLQRIMAKAGNNITNISWIILDTKCSMLAVIISDFR